LAYDGKIVQKETLALQENDTIFVKFKNNDYYSKHIDNRNDFYYRQDSANTDVIYSNNVRFYVMKTDEKVPYIQIEKLAEGKSPQEAKKRAENIKYAFKIEGNHIILDNYLLTEAVNKYRNQEVEIYLYLPEGVLFQPDMSVQYYDRSNFGLEFNAANEVYKMHSGELECLNCIVENEGDDMDGDIETETISGDGNDTIKTVTLKVNGKEIIRTETKKKGSLSVNEDGVIIKTN